jgi:hypothetical protein
MSKERELLKELHRAVDCEWLDEIEAVLAEPEQELETLVKDFFEITLIHGRRVILEESFILSLSVAVDV